MFKNSNQDNSGGQGRGVDFFIDPKSVEGKGNLSLEVGFQSEPTREEFEKIGEILIDEAVESYKLDLELEKEMNPKDPSRRIKKWQGHVDEARGLKETIDKTRSEADSVVEYSEKKAVLIAAVETAYRLTDSNTVKKPTIEQSAQMLGEVEFRKRVLEDELTGDDLGNRRRSEINNEISLLDNSKDAIAYANARREFL